MENKCDMCGEIIPPEYATKIDAEICQECAETFSCCCGAEIINSFCSDCGEHAE